MARLIVFYESSRGFWNGYHSSDLETQADAVAAFEGVTSRAQALVLVDGRERLHGMTRSDRVVWRDPAGRRVAPSRV